MPPSTALPQLSETIDATTRYLEAVDALDDDAVRAPSLLPGWTRAHVITHVARHADALTHALHGVLNGEEAWMYSSQEDRDAGVEAGASRSAAELHEDSASAWGRLLQTFNELHPRHLDVPVSRVPGGPTFLHVRDLPYKRRTEVEVHHADLGVGYTAADWPVDLALALVAQRQDELGVDGPSMALSATDVDGLWKLGSGLGPEIHGTASALAWWLLGRGEGAGLVSSTGQLPTLGRWR